MQNDPVVNDAAAADRLLALVGALAEEMHAGEPASGPVALDTQFERDLGFDSLARAELMTRIEQTFQIRLPVETFASAATPADLLQAIASTEEHPAVQQSSAARARLAPATESNVPRETVTLLQALRWHAGRHPELTHIVLLEDGATPRTLTYGQLYHRAMALARGLRAHGIGPSDTVALMLPTSHDYFIAFVGIMLCGAIVVPVYPPAQASQIEEHVRRHTALLSNAGAKALIASTEVVNVARLLRLNVPTIQYVLTPLDIGTDPSEELAAPQPEDIAFLQYTSGSTGDPKGVVLTHANLLANIRAMGQTMQVSADDVLISWLPLYHDMGLIGAWLAPMYFGIPLAVMSPLTFLARPERWLQAIGQYRGTITAAPNFAYERCARHIDDAALCGVDLSTLRLCCCGAEPVNPATMRAFAARFERFGFDGHALSAVYGLAENTLGLTFPPPGRGLRIDRIQRQPPGGGQQALPACGEDPFIELVGCGQPLPGTELRIVDETAREQPERQIGRIEFRGTSATAGYYRNPVQTARLMHDGWLDTGDLGYLADGELFITGRAKDLIIRAGRHFFPYELEDAIGQVPGIRPNCVAVCGSTDQASGTERIVILAETAQADPATRAQLAAQINAVAIAQLGAPAEQVCLVPPRSILKTPSGKIRHAATLERFQREGQRLAVRPIWRQLAGLVRDSIAPLLQRSARRVIRTGYGIWWWFALAIIAPPVWCMVVLQRDTRRSWRLAAGACRLLLRITGLHVERHLSEPTPLPQRVILAANHTSYLDALVLLAALPEPVNFVAKRELAGQRFAGPFLRAIGTRFVERQVYQASLEDETRLINLAGEDDTLLFFPEGTFGPAAGLRGFHLGAFRAACMAQRPIVPVALAGVRAVLPDGKWLPRRGRIVLTLLAPVWPAGTGFRAVTQLRDEVRHAIALHCGEPLLASTPSYGDFRVAGSSSRPHVV